MREIVKIRYVEKRRLDDVFGKGLVVAAADDTKDAPRKTITHS